MLRTPIDLPYVPTVDEMRWVGVFSQYIAAVVEKKMSYAWSLEFGAPREVADFDRVYYYRDWVGWVGLGVRAVDEASSGGD